MLARAGRATEQTERLISSEKVEATAVVDRNGEHLGRIHHLMIDKYRELYILLPCRIYAAVSNAGKRIPSITICRMPVLRANNKRYDGRGGICYIMEVNRIYAKSVGK
jgi:hypothetical protein